MPLKKQVTIAELKVGILVIIAVVLLGALILQQSWGVHWFRETVNAITYLGRRGWSEAGQSCMARGNRDRQGTKRQYRTAGNVLGERADLSPNLQHQKTD